MTNDHLVDELVKAGALRTPAYIAAFRSLDRAAFVPDEHRNLAYLDTPLPLTAEATISQPTTVALMFEWLAPQPGDNILDVGSGSGWTTALLARMVGPAGKVWAVELDRRLAETAARRLQGLGIDNTETRAGDGYRGWPEQAPFQRIHVAAAAPRVPSELVAQMSDNGRLVMPVGTGSQEIHVVTKSGDHLTTDRHPGFRFVPLKPS